MRPEYGHQIGTEEIDNALERVLSHIDSTTASDAEVWAKQPADDRLRGEDTY